MYKTGTLIAALALLAIAICTYRRPPLAAPSTEAVHFLDVTREAGIRFVHNTGAFGKKFLPETMGAGCAFIDYDNDGKPDILLVSGKDFLGHVRKHTALKLYHYNGNGTFTDLGEARLFHNERNGTFKDVTKTAGVNNTGFGASAAWVDYDKDGKLDLFVTNYAKWSEKDDIYCSLDGHNKSYCTPEVYKGDTCRLFHNLGNGRFEDATQKAGIYNPTSKSLGVAIIDYELDGWP